MQIPELATLRHVTTHSISPENFTGEKGGGGRASEGTGAAPARDLGVGWKVSPSVEIAPGEVFELARIEGAGRITHLWLTTHTDHWRTLMFRAHWDGAADPAIEVPVGDFFGQGWGRFAQLSSAMIATNPHGGTRSSDLTACTSHNRVPGCTAATCSIPSTSKRTSRSTSKRLGGEQDAGTCRFATTSLLPRCSTSMLPRPFGPQSQASTTSRFCS